MWTQTLTYWTRMSSINSYSALSLFSILHINIRVSPQPLLSTQRLVKNSSTRWLRKLLLEPSDITITTKEQQTFCRMLQSPAWKQLHQDHLVLKTDKNMGTTIVSHNWMTTNCHKFLNNHNMCTTYATYEDENAMQAFYDKLHQRISNQLSNIHKDLYLVSPSKNSYFLSFYMLLKVHKNLIRARPITGAFDSLTSRVSKTSDGLGEIYKILSKQAQAQGFTSALMICIKTKDVIKRANTTIQACTDSQRLSFTTFDFDGMYNHLDTTMTINTIKNLAIYFCNLSLDHPLQLAASRKKKSDFNPNTWNQLYDLKEHDPFSINISHLLLFLHVILEEYPFCICTYLLLKLFK
jgi:hypothetical protein